MRSTTIGLTALAAAATLALTACGGGSTSGSAPSNAPAGAGGDVTVALTGDGCQPSPATIGSGAVNFKVSNKDAGAVTEAELLSGGQMLGEQENLTPGLDGGFSLELAKGDYQIYCPGAKKDHWDFHVTGDAGKSWKDNPVLVSATTDYGKWVTDQVTRLVTGTQAFAAAVKSGDLTASGIAYGQARVFYEKVEPVAEIWGDLDKNIDGRVDDFDNPADFKGFHRIEQAIFETRKLDGMGPVADELVKNVTSLQQLVAKATYQPAEIANGATELVNEIQKSKVTGEEERYSHIDLLDFKANLDGSMEAFNLLLPALQKTAPELARSVQDRNAAVEAALKPYAQSPGYLNTGYVDYSTVSKDQQKVLSQAVNALGEAMSQVAAKVAQ
ncbi:iron uptake system protein EfeO [Kutzneria buriramensis]|uniref:Iron uptake system component EfeO n=1 Tax=Kutzneria buriramensis TaxID=1045776 RepID=A0A3E0IAP3_9PSEU|nr:iron uptake system protein EfeO [Kutzneria buriramensis]REH55709.1 iron uptake system component EfeO [Kutzneria buriramensis]